MLDTEDAAAAAHRRTTYQRVFDTTEQILLSLIKTTPTLESRKKSAAVKKASKEKPGPAADPGLDVEKTQMSARASPNPGANPADELPKATVSYNRSGSETTVKREEPTESQKKKRKPRKLTKSKSKKSKSKKVIAKKSEKVDEDSESFAIEIGKESKVSPLPGNAFGVLISASVAVRNLETGEPSNIEFKLECPAMTPSRVCVNGVWKDL